MGTKKMRATNGRPYDVYFGAVKNRSERANESIGPYKPLSGAARQLPQRGSQAAAAEISPPSHASHDSPSQVMTKPPLTGRT